MKAPRQAAAEVIDAYGHDVLTGSAPGISLLDMVETLIAERDKELTEKLRAGEGTPTCAMCNDTRQIGITGEESAAQPCSWCPEPPANIITSVRLEVLGAHAHVGVWVRGGKAGELVVDAGDAEELIRRLAPNWKDRR